MTPRIAVLRDFRAEGWPSMDLCADQLLRWLPGAEDVCPKYRRVAGRLPRLGRSRSAVNADRLFNRFAIYGERAAALRGRFDAYHVADHSYAHLVHHLPPHRTGVYCHDVDAFRCLVDPRSPRRPNWFRSMASRILAGMEKAAVVFHSTTTVRREIEAFGLVDPAKLIMAPLGVSTAFTDRPDPAVRLDWLDALGDDPWFLHVGSCIPRKRIDLLLDALAAVRRELPGVKLVKVGGEWTALQRLQIARLRLDDAIVHRTGVSEADLAEVYRRAPLAAITSDAEGFGLPVIEALACGALVAASDIPALRESGGPAAVFVPVGDVDAWTATVVRLLADPHAAPSRETRLAWARRFTWPEHARIIEDAYSKLAGGRKPRTATVP
jgi:glycosyltransferase involved in cell wall biosynthesis